MRDAIRWMRMPVVLAALLIGLCHPAGAAQPQTTGTAALPLASDWKRHFQRDILPFWERPSALGLPVGNFPTFRCNDGALYDPQSPCPEYVAAPEWIRGGLGRQYARMLSRQIYLYGVAFHLTGDQKYLAWAAAGTKYLLDHAFDPISGNIASYWQNGQAVFQYADRTSQDLAYDLIGPTFYYYLTRDPAVLQPILRIENYLRQTYYDPRLGLYRWYLQGPDADTRELVAQLDQANAYMLLLAPLVPEPAQKQWRGELAQIGQILRNRFYDSGSGLFLGTLAQRAGDKTCIFAREDTDFGHTIKTFWMLYFIARLGRDAGLEGFVRDKAPGVLNRAYLPDSGSWATQPSCEPRPGASLNRTSTWWMAAELDQAALTFGIKNAELLHYIPASFEFWIKHMVDSRYGEVWDRISLPDYTPQLPKIHLWKNGFHTAERALVGYIATSAIRVEPVELYYAFADCRLPAALQPYYFEGVAGSHDEQPLPEMPGFCRTKVTFAHVH